MICTDKKTFDIGPNTEVEVTCGLDVEEHDEWHFARDTHDEVVITFKWQGEFNPGKEE